VTEDIRIESNQNIKRFQVRFLVQTTLVAKSSIPNSPNPARPEPTKPTGNLTKNSPTSYTRKPRVVEA